MKTRYKHRGLKVTDGTREKGEEETLYCRRGGGEQPKECGLPPSRVYSQATVILYIELVAIETRLPTQRWLSSNLGVYKSSKGGLLLGGTS